MLSSLLGGSCLALCIAGCTSAGAGGEVSAQNVTQAWVRYGEGYCYQLFHCHIANDDRLVQALAFQNEETCRGVVSRFFQSDIREEVRLSRQLEASHALRVDEAMLATCVELGRSCSTLFLNCVDMFEGDTALGEPCLLSAQCSGNAYCAGASRGCGGVCTTRKPIGAACEGPEQCSAGSTGISACNGETLSLCVDLSERHARRGEPCMDVSNAQGVRVTCEADSWCDVSSNDESGGAVGTCKAPLPLGAECDDNDDVCVPGAFCAGEGSVAMSCKSVELRQGGQPCPNPKELALCDVYSGFTCDAEAGKCVPLGDGSLGSRCDADDLGEIIPCDKGLFCDWKNNTCQAPRSEGAACEHSRQCKSDNCDLQTDTCGPVMCEAT